MVSRKTPTYMLEDECNHMRKGILGALVLVIGLSMLSVTAMLGLGMNPFSSTERPFEISVNDEVGTNRYVMIEVDEGDNDEEEMITEIFHEFQFTSNSDEGMVTWDFGDGEVQTGQAVTHQFTNPGVHTVKATLVTGEMVTMRSLTVTVHLDSEVEADNMECACAPTGKDTIIVLSSNVGQSTLEGFVQVQHDGSSESCSLRNPLQECHVRVMVQTLQEGSVIQQDILFDDTFRSNEYVVDFTFEDLTLEEGQTLQLRLETDQVRDWHKPTAAWMTSAPLI